MLSTRFFKRKKQSLVSVMNVLLVLAVLTVQFAFGASSAKASNVLVWNNLEPVATTSESACSLSVSALSGVPYVAYCDENKQVWVKKYNGTGWDTLSDTAIGTAAADSDLAGNKAVVLYIDPADSAAVPYVAYTDTNYKLWVKKFNGSSWDTLGGGAVSEEGAAYINLYVSEGIPYVAYSDYQYAMKATAKAYDKVSDTWNILGSPGFTTDQAYFITFATVDGTSYLSFSTKDNDAKKFHANLFYFDSADWTDSGLSDVDHILLTLDPLSNESGYRYISFTGGETDNPNDYSVGRRNGKYYYMAKDPDSADKLTLYTGTSSWSLVGNAPASTVEPIDNNFGFYITASGTPFVAYTDPSGKIRVSSLYPPAPTLTADLADNDFLHDIVIPFTDNANWRNAIKAVMDGDTTLIPGVDYAIDAGNIVFYAGKLQTGRHTLIITASGYADATVIQDVNAISENAALSSLNLSDITLDQTVSGNVYVYTAAVPNDFSVTTVTYTTADSHATALLKLNGVPANNPVPLSVGSNVISVVVTAQDGTKKSYSVTVTRAGSSNAALSSLNLSDITLDQTVSENTYAYTATVPNSVTLTTATYTTTDIHATAVMSLNGEPVNNPISLNVGSNIISFVVTAQDGTAKTYTVSVTREPQLVTAITVSSTNTIMYVGDTLQFGANVTPDNATDKTVIWSVVPGTGIATINADGVLVATQAGIVTIQATAHDGSGVVGGSVVTIYTRSSNDDIQPAIPKLETVPSPPPTPNRGTDVFNSDVVKGDSNVVKNIETRIQEANKASDAVNPSDTKGHWAEKTITTFVKLQVIDGYNDGTFKPDGNITRAEFAVILNRVFDLKGGANPSTTLKDIDRHWAKDALKKLQEAGVIGGYEDDTFKPDNTITREEMVIMLSRVVNLNNLEKDATTKGNFNDLKDSYAANEIKALAQAGVISGEADGKFDAERNATRAEALQIILKALELNPRLKTLLDSLN